MKKTVVAIALLALTASFASAHSGRTDKNGGHRNSKTGKYHKH